jgi:hypothetical protein
LSQQVPDVATRLNRTKTPTNVDSICSDTLSLLGHKEDCDVALRKVTNSMNSAMAILDDLKDVDQESIAVDKSAKIYNDWSNSWVTNFDW